MKKYNYLKTQGVSNILYPITRIKNIRSEKQNNLIVMNYIDNKNVRVENHITSMFEELTKIHEQTKFKVTLSKDKSKKKIEEIYNYINYKFNGLEFFVRTVEASEFNENSIIILKNYQYLLDIQKEMYTLLRKIISDIKIGKSIEMCFIHNNPKVDHFVNDYNNKYYISIENSRIGICSLDIAKFYVENEMYNVDIESMIKDYFNSISESFYYDYFCFSVLLIYLKSLKVYGNDYVTSQNFLSICTLIKKFKSKFLTNIWFFFYKP